MALRTYLISSIRNRDHARLQRIGRHSEEAECQNPAAFEACMCDRIKVHVHVHIGTFSAATSAFERPTSFILSQAGSLRLSAAMYEVLATHAAIYVYGRSLRSCNAAPGAPEQELPVQIGHVDGVHVDDVDVAEARQRHVLE